MFNLKEAFDRVGFHNPQYHLILSEDVDYNVIRKKIPVYSDLKGNAEHAITISSHLFKNVLMY